MEKRKSVSTNRASGFMKVLKGGSKEKTELREAFRLAVLTSDRVTVRQMLAHEEMKVTLFFSPLSFFFVLGFPSPSLSL